MTRSELAKLADAATPHWWYDGEPEGTEGLWVNGGDGDGIARVFGGYAEGADYRDAEANAAFIGAMCPSVALVLLRRLDLAEQALAPLVAQMQRPGWCWACGYRPGHEARCRIAAAGRALASIRAPLDQPQETP